MVAAVCFRCGCGWDAACRGGDNPREGSGALPTRHLLVRSKLLHLLLLLLPPLQLRTLLLMLPASVLADCALAAVGG